MKAPPDIQKAAASVYAQLGRSADADEQAIAKTLMAERERCAATAKSAALSLPRRPISEEQADDIAAAILTPHPSPTAGAQ